jgi:hypothetical protein
MTAWERERRREEERTGKRHGTPGLGSRDPPPRQPPRGTSPSRPGARSRRSTLPAVEPITEHRAARLRFPRPPRTLALLALATCVLTVATAASAAGNGRRPATAPAILITTYRLTPRVQRTVHFTGYATYRFNTRPKRRIMSATARIVGAQAHAVKISSASVSLNRRHFTVKLVFPGEQGRPGKLVVVLGTVGA